MNQKNSHTLPSAISSQGESFHALANIYLAGFERMTELNLSTIRNAFEDSVPATKHRSNARTDSGFNLPLSADLQPMIEKSMAYSRSAYEILAETQQEAIKALTAQLGVLGGSFKIPTDWNASFDAVNRGVRQFTSVANQNASATTEAVRKSAEAVLKASQAT